MPNVKQGDTSCTIGAEETERDAREEEARCSSSTFAATSDPSNCVVDRRLSTRRRVEVRDGFKEGRGFHAWHRQVFRLNFWATPHQVQ